MGEVGEGVMNLGRVVCVGVVEVRVRVKWE